METTDTALATTLFVGEMLATEATSVKMMSKLPHKPVPRPQRRALLAADSHRRIVQAEPVDRRGQHRKVGLIGLKGCGMYTASDGKSPNQHPVSMSTTQSICGRRERGGVKSGWSNKNKNRPEDVNWAHRRIAGTQQHPTGVCTT